ncbi:Hypothetical predicted protein [Cloeon dipterum]|uniref:peptidylprolyl isomerase n=1 Tax=Cloeon dipterum TaxID=197152 RepID=A0A8S1BVJ4_9INSE|nr:Hypothetical predicted protein [Cloeon dipterum]
MRATVALLVLLVGILACLAAAETKKKLQIGVKKRVEGCTVKSRKGDFLHMHYTGKLEDGTEFDSSIPRNQPFTFTLGSGQVIKGWDQGLLGMCEGEKRKLVIPSDLGYGDRGSPPKIPPGATLIFDVELLKLELGILADLARCLLLYLEVCNFIAVRKAYSMTSWSAGSNVFVAIPEKGDLAAGKVLKENKSGTVRIQLDDGTKITVGPEDVFENPNKTPKGRQRSRSPARKSTGGRGRSPGRPKSPARAASTGRKRSTSRGRKANTTPKTKEEKPEKASTAKKTVEKKKEEPVSSPSMTLRVRRWNKDDNIDSDTEDSKNTEKEKEKEAEGPKVVLEYGGAIGIIGLLLIIIGVTFGTQMVFRSGTFNLKGHDWRALVAQWPKWDWLLAGQLVAFWFVQVILAVLPIGPTENALPGSTGPRLYRRNGLIAVVVTFGALLAHRRYQGYGMTKAQILTALPIWAATSVVAGLLLGIFLYWKGSRAPVSLQNPATVATSKVYAFLMGKQINPAIGNLHLKMVLLRIGILEALMLNLLIFLNLEPNGTNQLAALVMPSIYCLDAIAFEHNMLTSLAVQAEGLGAMTTVGMLLYPFLTVNLPLYAVIANVEMNNYLIGFIVFLYTSGLLINRMSCNQKHCFRKNPMDPAVSHLETLPTARGKKLLVSGWWGVLRHPNYFGDMLVHSAFGLISGHEHILPWFLPIFTTLILLLRVSQDHHHCQAKYGDAWSRYCERVKYRVLPKIY